MPTAFVPRPPSTRSRLARTAARLTIRPLERVIPDSPTGVLITRRVLASVMAMASTPPRDVVVEQVDERSAPHGRVVGEWVRPHGAGRAGIVLYLHGSGYCLCSTETHRPLVARLARESELAVFSLDYRLAPRHPFPAAADDVERAWAWLLAQGWRPDQIVVAGDSAGGHLALDLALELRRRGTELPAALLMMSPLADPTGGLCRARERVRRDPLLSAAGVGRLLAHYIGDTDPLHPRLTHVVADGEVLPPTLIQAGGAEMLAGDAHHLADMLAAAGTEVTLEVWPGQMHVFQAAPRLVPEADRALSRASRFLVEALHAATPATTTIEASA